MNTQLSILDLTELPAGTIPVEVASDVFRVGDIEYDYYQQHSMCVIRRKGEVLYSGPISDSLRQTHDLLLATAKREIYA